MSPIVISNNLNEYIARYNEDDFCKICQNHYFSKKINHTYDIQQHTDHQGYMTYRKWADNMSLNRKDRLNKSVSSNKSTRGHVTSKQIRRSEKMIFRYFSKYCCSCFFLRNLIPMNLLTLYLDTTITGAE